MSIQWYKSIKPNVSGFSIILDDPTYVRALRRKSCSWSNEPHGNVCHQIQNNQLIYCNRFYSIRRKLIKYSIEHQIEHRLVSVVMSESSVGTESILTASCLHCSVCRGRRVGGRFWVRVKRRQMTHWSNGWRVRLSTVMSSTPTSRTTSLQQPSRPATTQANTSTRDTASKQVPSVSSLDWRLLCVLRKFTTRFIWPWTPFNTTRYLSVVGIVPVSYLMRNLGEGNLRMRHHYLGGTGTKPLASALKVRHKFLLLRADSSLMRSTIFLI